MNDDTFPEGWTSAAVMPPAPGWYERRYSDGTYAHHWTGEHWTATKDGRPHWRQLADAPYPLWRPIPAADEPWDASQIKQPGWNHVEAAFIEGAREARANLDADEAMFRRAADGYTKRVFEEVDPISEAALRTGSWLGSGGVPARDGENQG